MAGLKLHLCVKQQANNAGYKYGRCAGLTLKAIGNSIYVSATRSTVTLISLLRGDNLFFAVGGVWYIGGVVGKVDLSGRV